MKFKSTIMMTTIALVTAVMVPAVGATSSHGGEVSEAYIGGSHTVAGVLRNVPGVGDVPLVTSFAVCQQVVSHPLFPGIAISTPGVGGACALRLPASTVSVAVVDASFGALDLMHQAVDMTGEPCAPLERASTGDVLTFPSDCWGLNVWPAATATYGTITLTAA